jgi:hypothetical protein
VGQSEGGEGGRREWSKLARRVHSIVVDINKVVVDVVDLITDNARRRCDSLSHVLPHLLPVPKAVDGGDSTHDRRRVVRHRVASFFALLGQSLVAAFVAA